MEKARLRQQDEQDNLERLERERETCQTNLDEAEHADTVVKYELQELTSVYNELEDSLLETRAWAAGGLDRGHGGPTQDLAQRKKPAANA